MESNYLKEVKKQEKIRNIKFEILCQIQNILSIDYNVDFLKNHQERVEFNSKVEKITKKILERWL